MWKWKPSSSGTFLPAVRQAVSMVAGSSRQPSTLKHIFCHSQMVILVMHPILFHYLSVKIPLIKFSILKTIYLLRKKSLKARLPPKRKRSELSKPDYPISSDSMNLQQYKTSTQHSILHSVPLTHIRKNVLSGKKHTERKLLQSSKPYTTK